MNRNERDDFFQIEEIYDVPETADTPGVSGADAGSSPAGAADAGPGAAAFLYYEAAKALARCINEFGRVNLPWMSADSGLSIRELIEELDDAIYQEPERYNLHRLDEEDWILRSQYVSGNIKEKFETAKRLNRKYDGRFERNLRALKKAMPERVPFREIGLSIGSSWIPENYYAAFAKELLGIKTGPKVTHSARLGQWKVEASSEARNAFSNYYTYGYTYGSKGMTKCVTMLQILEHTLNGNTVKIYEEVERPDRKSGKAWVLLKNETVAAQEKQELLQKAFQEWIVKDPMRVKHLERIFYETYTCNVAGRYDGGFLTLPGLNPSFHPYPHQRDAVARIILDKDVLLNHAVGSGKTNILIMGLHERYRMGLSPKNLVVVPNNVLEAFERAHRYLYPEDKFLVVSPEEFNPVSRQEFLEKIRDGDYVACYMAFSSFERLEMSRQYKLEKKSREISAFRAAADAATGTWEKKRLESRASELGEELIELRTELPLDEFLPFDQLGITTLVVDEAHNFKNVALKTGADKVAGLSGKGSRKCNEMMEKVQYVRGHGGSVLFSTGTPLTNSLSDLFVLQQYLQPEQMELLHLGHFDEWIGSFASRQSSFEIDVDSQSFRVMTRFSKFHNLPELTGLFANVCDFYNGADGGFGLPECGAYIDTVVPKSPEQAEYIEELVLRTEMIRQKLVKAHEDNLLKVTHDGRAAALDVRLVRTKAEAEPGTEAKTKTGAKPGAGAEAGAGTEAGQRAETDPKGTKTYACAKNVYRCWCEYPGTAQLVFCDLGTPKQGFNIYDELKNQLIQMGIPEEQIAFVHDAKTDTKRRRLFEAVNRAQVRVLVGSTCKLGMGVNVQENLIALHHLDVPWKPSDIIQREGRMIRQGNRNKKVFRYRYITAGTFDAYSWQILENKQRFIGQFMAGALADREAGDIDDAVLTYAEIKALCIGDPLLRNRIEISNDLERAKIHSRQREQELRRMRNIVEESPKKLEKLGERKKKLCSDRSRFQTCREKLSREDRQAFGEELLFALGGNADGERERCFDQLHGFRVYLPAGMKAEKPFVELSGVTDNRYYVDMRDAREGGCVQRIEYLLLHLKDRICAMSDEIKRARKELGQAKAELEKGNPYAAAVFRLNEKLLDIDQELVRRAEESAA